MGAAPLPARCARRRALVAGAAASLLSPALRASEPPAIALPPAAADGSLGGALARRRSVRRFAVQALALADVAALLWAAQGVSDARGLRTAPSAGALYPLELHLVARRVDGLAPGSYRYAPAAHALRPTPAGAGALAAGGQAALAEAPVVLAIAALQARTAARYGERASRYVALEAGAAAQNLALQAASLGLGTVLVGAFDDDAVARALALRDGERPLALMPVGRPAPA